MTPSEWIALGSFFVAVLALVGGATWRTINRMDKMGENIRADMSKIETRWSATQAKSDLDFAQFCEDVNREFLRRGEYEVAQKNTDRRLESIEQKVDKIPESLDRQSERLIAVLKETRS